jgi:hypothetical protein
MPLSSKHPSKDQVIKENMAKIKAQNYPLIQDLQAENAIEIMSDILKNKNKKKDADLHGQEFSR